MMKSTFFWLLSSVCALGASDAYADMSSDAYSFFDWFAVEFSSCADDTPLAKLTGVSKVGGEFSGCWTNFESAVAAVRSHQLQFAVPSTGAGEASFLASKQAATNDFDGSTIEMTARYDANDSLPTLSSTARSALTVYEERTGVYAFYGYTALGWVRLSHPSVSVSSSATYTQRTAFVRVCHDLYVTYAIKSSDGSFCELADDDGVVRHRCAASGPINRVRLIGTTDLVSLAGTNVVSVVLSTETLPPGIPYFASDWFDVRMEGVASGTALASGTGVRKCGGVDSGSWSRATGEFAATVYAEGAEASDSYLNVESSSTDTFEGPSFTAVSASSNDHTHVELSMRFFRGTDIPIAKLASGAKAALTMSDVGGVPTFMGCVRDGLSRKWTALSADGVTAEYGRWYDLQVDFADTGSGAPNVSYFVRTETGYVALADVSGATTFASAYDLSASESDRRSVRYVDLMGSVDVRSISGRSFVGDTSSVYHWIGGSIGAWRSGANWSHTIGGEPCADEDFPKRYDSSVAVVSTDATITTDGDVVISNLVVNAAVTLRGDAAVGLITSGGSTTGLKGNRLRFSSVCGTGVLSLEDQVLEPAVEGASVAGALSVPTDSTGAICLPSGPSLALTVSGPVTGSGKLLAYQDQSDAGVVFAGSNAGFTGTYEESVKGDADAGRTTFASGSAAFANAKVSMPHSMSSDASVLFGASGETYQFGAYDGCLSASSSKATVEIGSRGEDCSITGEFSADVAGSLATLVKVGSARLTVGKPSEAAKLGRVEIRDGELKIMSEDPFVNAADACISFAGGTLLTYASLDYSALIRDSSGPIAFNDSGISTVWSSPLAASNVGGLTKSGTGSLYLTNAVPRYSGPTRVLAGRLVLRRGTALGVVSVASSAKLVVDLTGVTDADELLFSAASSEDGTAITPTFINVPAGYAVPDPQRTSGGGVIYAKNSRVFTWVGGASDGLGHWSNPDNWKVDGELATSIPGAMDLVKIPAGTRSLTVDTQASAWRIEFASGAQPLAFASPLITAENYTGVDTASLTVESGAPFAISGTGNFATPDDLILESSDSQAFYGSISAAKLVKRGSGEALLAGENEFASVTIESGTLKLGGHDSVAALRFDFDASATDTVVHTSSGLVSAWKSRSGSSKLEFSDGQYATYGRSFLGTSPSLDFSASGTKAYSRYAVTPSNRESGEASRALFVVYQPASVASGSFLYSESTTPSRGLAIRGADSLHYWWNPETSGVGGIYTGLDPMSSPIVSGTAYLTSWLDAPFAATAAGSADDVFEYLGTSGTGVGFCGSVAEVVAYTASLSEPERLLVQKSLLSKWGVGGVSYSVLPVTAAVTITDGATLDLGGLDQTVASFSGAGTVRNGRLRTADGVISQSGGTLTVPAVSGVTYGIDADSARLVITDGVGVSVTVQVPWGCSSARVFCEGTVTWEMADKRLTVKDEGDGWYSISNQYIGTRLRIR